MGLLAPLNPPVSTWTDQVVWLIGASTGIGRSTASALHARGARVVISARSREALDAFTAAHPGSEALALDTTDAHAMRAAAQSVLARHGRLDLVCYCAGYYRPMRAYADGPEAFDLADVLRHEQVNVVGAWHMLDAVLPTMTARRRGHISLVSSVAGYSGLPRSLAYGPTKAALINLAETLYLDLAPCGIGVSLVSPGFVDTPLTAQNQFPMPALQTPEQAAHSIIKGWEAGHFEIHFPKRFTRWLKLLRMLPYRLYFKLVGQIAGAPQ